MMHNIVTNTSKEGPLKCTMRSCAQDEHQNVVVLGNSCNFRARAALVSFGKNNVWDLQLEIKSLK